MIVLVTGATAGFGTAIARRFAADGARIVAAARRAERLEALKAELGADKVLPLVLDVRDRAAVMKAVEGLPAEWAAVDVLVNNAGLALGLDPAQKADLDDWDTMVDTNVKGLMYLTRAVLPGMIERKCGHVINLGSTAGEWPYPGGNVYGATKAFVRQFSLNLRADLYGTPVRVTDIQPGLVGGTEFSCPLPWRRREGRRRLRGRRRADAGRHRRCRPLGRDAPGAGQREHAAGHAGLPELRPAARPQAGELRPGRPSAGCSLGHPPQRRKRPGRAVRGPTHSLCVFPLTLSLPYHPFG